MGLLGSPPFEIPRTVERDKEFAGWKSPEQVRLRLPAKNRHNAWTVVFFLLSQWFTVFVDILAIWATTFLGGDGILATMAALGAMLVLTMATGIVTEKAALGFGRLVPRLCSIYDVHFWQHERYWKLSATAAVQIFNGTPFKPVIWRIFGVRMGRRVFDDGCGIPERTLVAIGDYCTLNAVAVVQCHSMEDGAFKLDAVDIGPDCTLGVGSFIHYGVSIRQGAEIAADSFLMKGEVVPEGAAFGGNPPRGPARPVRPASWRDGLSAVPGARR
ncbi:hypothetical protein ACQCSX_05105 [Pseudarthrobacter sp. P1]|uniref:hypothetical protein n=1 Tax=Pseudarthrobacter sp. P1 TaxID=3418418 RepID=UPI003CE76DBE